MFTGGIKYTAEEEKLALDVLRWMSDNGKQFREE